MKDKDTKLDEIEASLTLELSFTLRFVILANLDRLYQFGLR